MLRRQRTNSWRCLGCGAAFGVPPEILDRALADLPLAQVTAGEILSLHLRQSKGCLREYVELGQTVRYGTLYIIPSTLYLRQRLHTTEVLAIAWPAENAVRLAAFGDSWDGRKAARAHGLALIAQLHQQPREPVQ